jgi:hypothetical protein
MPEPSEPTAGTHRRGTPAEPVAAALDRLEVLALSRQFAEFAEEAAARLPLYRRLSSATAEDLDVVGRLLLAPSARRVPNLLLAAVHDVLLAGDPSPLADWYPSVPGRRADPEHRARPVGAGDDDPWPHFRELALHHEGVAERLRTRATQTNEVGRCLPLLPALFRAAQARAGGADTGVRDVGLIDVGSSAGLNLRLDRYGYRYHRPGGEAVVSVGAGSRLMLDCRLRGDLVPPLPEVPVPLAAAVGLDLLPLHVADPADARWLVACQWPEQLERLDRLRAAVELAAVDPPLVVQGDAVDDLAPLVEAVPGHALPVVVATWALCYLPVDRQVAFMAELDRLGAQRHLALVFAEQPQRVPGLPVPPRADGVPDGRATALVHLAWRGGDRIEERLADQHPHGTWLEWLAR